jgi:peptidoglycan/xylan/chitin deacetylase (PgdA/CDA1 family)
VPRLRLPERLPRREIVVPVLLYHRINLPPPTASPITRGLVVHPADFARQMMWLKRHGYRAVTQRQLFAALLSGRSLGRRPIMITFDDGYRDVFYRAAPVLSRLGIRATAYVISRRIVNGDRHFLSWGLLRALERRGIETGSHTVSHRDLTQLSDRAVLEELVRSRRALERGLCHPVQWLAYHHGRARGTPFGPSTAGFAAYPRSRLDRRPRARGTAQRASRLGPFVIRGAHARPHRTQRF